MTQKGKHHPKQVCPTCGLLVSVHQFTKHQSTKACAEMAAWRKKNEPFQEPVPEPNVFDEPTVNFNLMVAQMKEEEKKFQPKPDTLETILAESASNFKQMVARMRMGVNDLWKDQPLGKMEPGGK